MDKTRVDKTLFLTGRSCYAFGLGALGIQQLIYAEFRTEFVPDGWPAWIHRQPIWAYLCGAGLVIAGVLFLTGKCTKRTGLITGSVLLLFLLAFHLPYEISHIDFQFGSYADCVENMSLAGGALIIAGTIASVKLGRLLFCINMVWYGLSHFFYPQFVGPMVPGWIPWHLFWTYFAGIALVGSGIAIACNVWRRPIALLQGLMIFGWLLLIHLPAAIAHPLQDKGSLCTSVFVALVFIGIAWMIAGRSAQPGAPTPSRR